MWYFSLTFHLVLYYPCEINCYTERWGPFFRRWTGTLRTGSQVLSAERNGHVCWRSSVRDSELCPRPRACPVLATGFVYSSLYEVLEALAWIKIHLLLLQIIRTDSHLKLRNLLLFVSISFDRLFVSFFIFVQNPKFWIWNYIPEIASR